MGKKKRNRIGFLRYIVYLALVSSVIASVTMAKYSAEVATKAEAVIAAFVTGTTLDVDVPLGGMVAPGDAKTVTFQVTNFDGEQNANVSMGYEIQVDTTGNLPLEFSLLGEKQSEDTDTQNSVLVGPLDPITLKAEGGKLPFAHTNDDRKIHTYQLKVTWPAAYNDEGYSDEIDRVTLKITSKQLAG